ncbi:MAG: ABC transporter ATP-binding protein [Marmoricola sp.]
MLEVTGLSLAFGGIHAVDGLDFSVGDRTVQALIGANGAGKTSVLNVLSRFYRPQHGQVVYDDTDLLRLRPHELIGQGVGRSFQNVALFKELPVLDNLLVGADHLGNAGLLRNTFRTPRARRHERQARARAERVMEFLEITGLRRRRAGELSFGDQKLVDMGRALTAEPSLLLLDEPASGMADNQREWLAETIRRIPDEFGASVLLIDHDMSLVMGVSSRVVVMDFGRKIAEGEPESVRHDERVIKAYLGEV